MEAESSSIVDAICELPHDEIIEFIMALDLEVADLDFTERLIARLKTSVEAEDDNFEFPF
jgi:hypothetical protein